MGAKKEVIKHPKKDPSTNCPPTWACLEGKESFTPQVREWWQNHLLCKAHRLLPREAHSIGVSAQNAAMQLQFGRLYADSQSFYTDLAVSRFLREDSRTTGRRFAELGSMLLEAEGMKVKLKSASKLIEKISNHMKNGSPDPLYLNIFSTWLNNHWVSGELLCVLTYKEIMARMKPYNLGIYSEDNVAKHIKRLGLLRMSSVKRQRLR